MNDLISVIVPVYNVEKYLARCVDSIIAQTYSNLEIILVDDGATDRSGLICDEYAQKDSRIRVIHKENGGLSDARNAGLDVANGELIGFIDSDDYIAPDMYEVLYQNLKSRNADIATCGVFNCFPNRIIPDQNETGILVLNSYEAIRNALESSNLPLYAWNKLYKKYLFSNVRFPVGKIYEDAFVMIRLLDLTNTVVVTMEPKYYYMRRPESITMRNYRPADLDIVEAHMTNREFILDKYPDLAQQAEFRYLWANFMVLDKMLLATSEVDIQKKKEIVSLLRKNVRKIVKCQWLNRARKISAICLCIHERLYKSCVVIRIKKMQ